jgi:hypothetical protein
VSEDASGLSEPALPQTLLHGFGRIHDVLERTAAGRPMWFFHTSMSQDARWWDDKPSTYELSCAILELDRWLSITFHVEVGGIGAASVIAGRRPRHGLTSERARSLSDYRPKRTSAYSDVRCSSGWTVP